MPSDLPTYFDLGSSPLYVAVGLFAWRSCPTPHSTYPSLIVLSSKSFQSKEIIDCSMRSLDVQAASTLASANRLRSLPHQNY